MKQKKFQISYCTDNKYKASKKHLLVSWSVWIIFGGAVQGLDWGSTMPPQSSSGRHLLLRPSWAAAAVARLNYSEIESGPTRRDAVRRGEARRPGRRPGCRPVSPVPLSARPGGRGGEARGGKGSWSNLAAHPGSRDCCHCHPPPTPMRRPSPKTALAKSGLVPHSPLAGTNYSVVFNLIS